MNLTLKIIKVPEGSQLMGKTIEVDSQGLSIGRAENNDLVLPGDSTVSKQHAVIQYQQGNYYIYDVSTNGVYINNSLQPLNIGEQDNQLLTGQEIIRIGGYTLKASLARDKMAENSEVDLDSLLNQSGIRSPLLAEERQLNRDEQLFGEGQSNQGAESEFDLDRFLRGEVSPQPAFESIKPSFQESSYTAVNELQSLFEQLGLSDYKMDNYKQKETLEKLTSIIKITLQCMIDSLHKRQESLQALGLIAVTFKKTGNNPFLFSANGDEALRKLLFPLSGEAYLAPEQAIPECFADLENYQYYLAMAAKETLQQAMEKFSPKEVADLLCDVEVKKGLFGGKSLVNFDNYEKYYQKINEQAENQLNRMLQKNFLQLKKE